MTSIGGGGDSTIKAMMEVQEGNIAETSAEKRSAKEAFKASITEMVNPYAAKIRAGNKSLKDHVKRVVKLLKKGDKSDHLDSMKFRQEKGNQFEQRNPELKSKSLVALRERIEPEDSLEEIIDKVKGYYPDVTLADEALDFLLETTEGDLHLQVRAAKDELYRTSEREILAGRNISELARETEGLGTPTTLRDLYRNITGFPKDALSLFNELTMLYPFNQLKKVFRFLFHSLGNDLKSKGPSIPGPELQVLGNQTKVLQAILGVYRFFASKMKLVQYMFLKVGEQVPPKITFETLSKLFMAIVAERYPSQKFLLDRCKDLGVRGSVYGEIIVLSIWRDAINQVSTALIFRSIDHKNELQKILLDTLEELEYQWEEILDQAEEPEDSLRLEEN